MTGRNRRNFSPEFRLEAAQLVLDQHDTIISCQRPDHRYKKASKEHIDIPNYLDRQFTVTEPNQAWCGDVTYIWAGKRWAYLAVVLDLFSCKPVQETQYDAVRKVIYRAIRDASKKWSMPVKNGRLAMSRFIIEFGDRLSDHL